MPKATEEPASRANDQAPHPPRGKEATGPGDGKDSATPQGGKRRGPGRWEQPMDAADGD